MFRTLIYPSSGTCDCVVELPHRSFCSTYGTTVPYVDAGVSHRVAVEEQNDRCGNSATQSQAPADGYINVRNMLST